MESLTVASKLDWDGASENRFFSSAFATQVAVAMIVALTLASLVGCNDADTSEGKATKSKTTAIDSSKSKLPKESASKDEASKASTLESPFRWKQHTKDIGFDFVYRNGEESWLYAMIETLGGGSGLVDYDRDGDDDLFLPGGGDIASDKTISFANHSFFRRSGNLQFQQTAKLAAVESSSSYSTGVAIGDYDQDGFDDVLITGYGGQQLLRNMGDGTFEDCTEVSGLVDRRWSACAAWCDLNNDSQLDAYVSHYAQWNWDLEKPCFSRSGQRDRCVPADFEGEADQILIQSGDGAFRDESAASPAMPSRGLAVAAGDWDIDGDIDLYVVNDVHPNLFLLNDGQARFEEIGSRSGTSLGSRSVPDGSMGIGVGDFDGNGLPDFLVTNYQDEYCELYANQGKAYYRLATRPAGLMGLGSRNVCWGTNFLDADLDGDEDLMVVAGHTSRYPSGTTTQQLPYMLENVDKKRLVNHGGKSGDFFAKTFPARGHATGDLDGDGDLDCIVSMVEQPSVILENDTPSQGRYLFVDLVGTKCNRNAIGAYVECRIGANKLVRHRYSGGSFASSNSPTLHFGLGDIQQIDEVTVHWPSGETTVLANVKPDQRITVIENIQ
jgi:enediyne biosynthesis protein E4